MLSCNSDGFLLWRGVGGALFLSLNEIFFLFFKLYSCLSVPSYKTPHNRLDVCMMFFEINQHVRPQQCF